MQIYLHWQPPLHTLSFALSFSFPSSISLLHCVWLIFRAPSLFSPSHSHSVKYLDRKEVAAEAEQTISYSACNVIASFPHFRGLKWPRKGMQRTWKGRGGSSPEAAAARGRGCCQMCLPLWALIRKGQQEEILGDKSLGLNDHFLYLTWQQTLLSAKDHHAEHNNWTLPLPRQEWDRSLCAKWASEVRPNLSVTWFYPNQLIFLNICFQPQS